jgi:hypothetical protein
MAMNNTRWIRGLVLASSILAGRAAQATSNFPDAVQRDLGLAQTPDCSLCHAGGITGLGTVTTPFGTSMRARGLVASDENSLKTALDLMAKSNVDSDGDGIPDIVELRDGTDPNAPGNVEPVSYGCSIQNDSESRAGSGPLAAGLVLGVLTLLRRLPRRTKQS